MNPPIAQQVRLIAAEVFSLDPADVRDDLSPQSVETWDSMEHLNFVLALEARLGLRFALGEIEQMSSVGEAIRIAQQKASQR
jgi:acyl carrier protein